MNLVGNKLLFSINLVLLVTFASASETANFIKLYKQSLPSTVIITNFKKADKIYQFKSSFKNIENYNYSGAGFILTSDGYIVTNAHVVSNAYNGNVILADGQSKPYTLIGEDLKRDIALIKIDDSHLKAAKIGNSDKIQPGEVVYSIGTPEETSFAFTNGTIAATQVNCAFSSPIDSFDYCIRLNIPIYPGNSGGALFNSAGEVIGINTSVNLDQNYKSLIDFGSGNAIPINTVITIVEGLKQYGRFIPGDMGITYQPISNLYESMLGLTNPKTMPGELTVSGVLISSVKPKSQAEKDGFKNEDFLIKVNNEVIRSQNWLSQYLYLAGPNKKIRFELIRDKKLLTLTTSTESVPDNFTNEPTRYFQKLGVALQTINLNPKDDFGYAGGLKLISQDSYFYDSLGLNNYDTIIVEIDHQKVTNLDDIEKLIANLKDGQIILIKFITKVNGKKIPYYSPLRINI